MRGDILEYTYRLNLGRLLLELILAGASAAGLGYYATVNDRALSIYHLVTLPPAAATILLLLCAAVAGFFAVISMVELVSGSASKTYRIRLTRTDLTAPKGYFMQKHITVQLSDIGGLTLQKAGNAHYLQLKTPHGKITINRSHIGVAAFSELCHELAARL